MKIVIQIILLSVIALSFSGCFHRMFRPWHGGGYYNNSGYYNNGGHRSHGDGGGRHHHNSSSRGR